MPQSFYLWPLDQSRDKKNAHKMTSTNQSPRWTAISVTEHCFNLQSPHYIQQLLWLTKSCDDRGAFDPYETMGAIQPQIKPEATMRNLGHQSCDLQVYHGTYVAIFRSISPLHIYHFVCLSVRPSVCQSVCPSVHLSLTVRFFLHILYITRLGKFLGAPTP